MVRRKSGASARAAEPTAAAAVRPLGDLFAVADRLAAVVGGPVILEDPAFCVVAYSAFVGPMDRGRAEAILGRRIPSRWLEHLSRTGSLHRLRTTSDVIDVVDGPWDAHRRLITSVRDGSRQVGVVWVAEGDEPLGADAAAVLRDAVDGAAPHFVRHHEVAQAEQDRRARTVRALLAGERVPAGPVAELGLDEEGTFAVLAVAGLPDSEPAAPGDTAGRRLDHVLATAEALRWQCVAAPSGRTVQAIVVVPRGGTAAGVGRLGREVVRSAAAAQGVAHAATSSLGHGLGALVRLRDEALCALAVVAARPEAAAERFARYDEVEAEVVVRGAVRSLPPDLGLAGLRLLEAHDARADGSSVTTLRAYLAAGGRVSEAATALNVHASTLRYRLGRIAEVSGLRLDDPHVRLACDLLLRRDAVDSERASRDRRDQATAAETSTVRPSAADRVSAATTSTLRSPSSPEGEGSRPERTASAKSARVSR